ncbi:MAG TPA: glycosyltransferase family 4 protein [Bacteroidales bacterium]|nr:glycosyltransferase family 4 protein [Bacteroidales bacterium]
MKKVLIITYYWPPSGGAGVQRWLKLSKFLPEHGWEPIILTVDPDYATYPVRDELLEKEVLPDTKVIKTKSREWFSAYKKISGGKNVPYAGFASEDPKVTFKQKLARFIRGNFFIPDPRKGWNRFAYKVAFDLLSKEKINHIITTGPPQSTHLIGLKLKKNLEHIHWIADFRDPWTDIYYYKDFYPTRIAHGINLQMEKRVLNKADMVLTVSPSWKKLFEQKITHRTNKVRVLTNGYDPENMADKVKSTSNKMIITYIGTMSDIYPFDGFIDAFSRFSSENPDAILRFIGTISTKQEKKIKSLPDQRYEIIDYVPHAQAIDYLFKSSVLLIIIPTHSSSDGIVPGKLFEYMAVGTPVIYLGPLSSDGASIVNRTKAGEAIDADDAESIYQTLRKWGDKLPDVSPAKAYSRKKLAGDLSSYLTNC